MINSYAFAPAFMNVALASNGAAATASEELGPGFPASSCNNGLRHTNNQWTSGGGWAPSSTVPQWLQIDFGASRTITEIDVFTLADAANYNTDPTLSDTFTLYGASAYEVQQWNGSSFVNITSVSGNNKVWRQFTFSPVTTTKIRINVTAAPDGYARLVEVEAWGG